MEVRCPPLLAEPAGPTATVPLATFPKIIFSRLSSLLESKITLMPTFRNVLLSESRNLHCSSPHPGWRTTGSFWPWGPQSLRAAPHRVLERS